MESDGTASRGCFQSAKPLCQENRCENERICFCKNCSIALCRKCIQKCHLEHNWITIQERARECKDEADIYKKKLEELIEKQNNEIKDLNATVAKNRENLDKKLLEIDNRENIMKAEVQEHSRKLKRQCEDNHRDREGELQRLTDQKRKEVENLTGCIEFFVSRLASSSDAHIVECTQDIKLKIESYMPTDLGPLQDRSGFIAGRNNFSELHDMIGKIDGVVQNNHLAQTQDIVLLEVSNFHFSPGLESTILFKIRDDMAFHQTEHRKVQLTNNKGHSIQEFDIGRDPALQGHQLFTFTKLGNDDLIFCCRNQKGLWRMNSEGWVTCIVRDLQSYPTGLLTLNDGNLLICSASEPFNYMKSSTGMISITNISINEGSRSCDTLRIVHKFFHNSDASKELFKWPYRAAENRNTDLCIVDFLTTESSVLKVIDRKGNLKFCYCGQFLSKPFLASSVACDSHCRIILNDNLNHRIHLLSQEGSFMKFLWHEPKRYPWTLALSPSCSFLWVHFGKNTIKVFQYERHEFQTSDCNIQWAHSMLQ